MEKTENNKKKIWLFLVILVTIVLLYIVFVQNKKDSNIQPAGDDIQNTVIEPDNKPADMSKEVNTNNNLNNKNNMTDIKDFSFEVLKEGSGAEAVVNNTTTVQYKGMFVDGKVFDQGEFSFVLGIGQVVQGFDKGVLGMKVGESRKIYIPSEMGYGSRGAGSAIPPNTDLIFEVTLKSIN